MSLPPEDPARPEFDPLLPVVIMKKSEPDHLPQYALCRMTNRSFLASIEERHRASHHTYGWASVIGPHLYILNAPPPNNFFARIANLT